MQIHIINKLQTVESLFGEHRFVQYRIPIYQRRYVWNELNWERFWTDICDTLHKNIDLFAGVIVTRQHPNRGDQEIYDVIDGQQRLTTLQIILCVIRRYLLSQNSWADPNEIRHITESAITNRDRLVNKIGPDARNKLCPKSDSIDEEAFEVLIDWNRPIPVSSNGDSKDFIYGAYRHFNSMIEKYNYDKIKNLHDVISNKIKVAHLNLYSDENDEDIDNDAVTPEIIFASLNATGRMLSEFDYLRNDLFLRAAKDGAEFYGDKDYWHPSFENDILDLDTFLRAFLETKLGPSCFEEKKKPFELYQYDYRSTISTVGEEFKQLSAYAQFNEDMNDPSSEIGTHMSFYEDLRIQPLTSFLLFAQEQKVKRPSIELSKIYKILESYIIRGMLCTGQHNYQNIESFLSEAIVGKQTFSEGNFAKFLEKTWPDYRPVQDALNGASLLAETSVPHRNIFLYIFYRIELYLRREAVKAGTKTLDYAQSLSFKDFKTLERIVIADDLEESLSEDDTLDRIYEVYDAINRIGNIVALGPGSPSNWAYLSFPEKQSKLETNPTPNFTLNRYICARSKWGLDEIKERTKDLYDNFTLIWPYANRFF